MCGRGEILSSVSLEECQHAINVFLRCDAHLRAEQNLFEHLVQTWPGSPNINCNILNRNRNLVKLKSKSNGSASK